MSIINRPVRLLAKKSFKELKNGQINYKFVKKKCKIRFNKPIELTINNLLKPLLSKPETLSLVNIRTYISAKA